MATHSSILVRRMPMDRGAWRATVHGAAELDTTERLAPTSLWREKHCSCERGDLPGGAASGKVLLGVWGGRAPGPFPCPVSAAPEKGPRGALRFDVCNWKGGHPSPSGPGAWQPQPRGWPLPWTRAWDQEGSSLAHGRQEPRRSGLDCSPLWASRLLDLLTAAAFRAGPPGSPGPVPKMSRRRGRGSPSVLPQAGAALSGWPGPQDHARLHLRCSSPSPGTSVQGASGQLWQSLLGSRAVPGHPPLAGHPAPPPRGHPPVQQGAPGDPTLPWV